MSIFLLSFTVIAIAFLGMAVGVLFGRPPLNAGSCGQRGVGCFGMSCGFCAEDRQQAGAPSDPATSAGEQ